MNRRTALRAWILCTPVLLATAALGFAALGSSPSAAQPGRTSATTAAPVPHVTVDPSSGRSSETFTASGSGCDGGLVTMADADQPGVYLGQPVIFTNDGRWSVVIHFIAPVGHHTTIFTCSDYSTAGAPTTFLAPGTLRFRYLPVETETLPDVAATPPTSPATTPTIPTSTPPTGLEWSPIKPAPIAPGADPMGSTATFTG